MFTVVCTIARYLPTYWARCINSKPPHPIALKINFKTDLPCTYYAKLLHACVLHRKLREPTWIRGKSCAVEWKSATLDRPAFIDHAQKKEKVFVSHIRGEPEPSYRPSPPSAHTASPNAIWIRTVRGVYYCQGYQPEGSLFSIAQCSEQWKEIFLYVQEGDRKYCLHSNHTAAHGGSTI